ncbi:MAG TPA: hypothetical protein EYH20_05545 [Leucothrix sp.]|nr:hypothetical protein [Leucothrix sp.]
MLRFFLGILLIQSATVALVLLAPENLQGLAWLRLLIPLLVVGFFSAFWFSSMSKHKNKDEISQIQAQHAREREKLQVNAERAKTRLIKKTQQQIAKETKIAHGKANFKVGAALAGVMGFGALMLLTQFLTLGVVTLTTAGGALGGYFYRSRKEKNGRLNYSEQGHAHAKVISPDKPKKALRKSS